MKTPQRFVLSKTPSLIIALLCVVGSSHVIVARGQEAKEKTVAVPKVSLSTVYLSDPIGNAHQIKIVGELGGQARVILDGNACTTSIFGDTQICTEIHFPPIETKLVQLRIADPTGQGRRIFRLEGNLLPTGATYHLIVPRRRSSAHRLVVDLENDHRRVATLEPVPDEIRGKPELCQEAEYRAEQADGKVTLYAQGEHATAAWNEAFEQLPIRIFPPQFRLVCFPPKGVAAQVITPFEAKTSFTADQRVEQVIVHDARGQHRVPVKQDQRNTGSKAKSRGRN